MKKLLSLLFVNILLIFTVFYSIETYIYNKTKETQLVYCSQIDCSKRFYFFNNPPVFTFDISSIGRKMPLLEQQFKNTNIKNNPPVVLFGCSFAYGMGLEEKQTFAYKLSKILNKNVINRSVIGGGPQFMYLQSTSDEFYKIVPYAKDVIYIIISDHPRRMLVDTFNVQAPCFFLHYSFDKNKKFKISNYNNPLLNFVKSLYIVRLINHVYVQYKLSGYTFSQQITDEELAYFTESRNNLEKHWGSKVNFNVIIYDSMPFEQMLINKLKENGFNVIQIENLTYTDKADPKYYLAPDDAHPSETAWDIYTPLIAKKLLKD